MRLCIPSWLTGKLLEEIAIHRSPILMKPKSMRAPNRPQAKRLYRSNLVIVPIAGIQRSRDVEFQPIRVFDYGMELPILAGVQDGHSVVISITILDFPGVGGAGSRGFAEDELGNLFCGKFIQVCGLLLYVRKGR
jgi:hypothetical protein